MTAITFQFPTLTSLHAACSKFSVIQMGRPLVRGASFLLVAYSINDYILPLGAAQEMPEEETPCKNSSRHSFQTVLSYLLCAESQQVPRNLVEPGLLEIVESLPQKAIPIFKRHAFKARFDSRNFSILFDYLKETSPIPHQMTFMNHFMTFLLSDFETLQRLSRESENANEWIQKVKTETRPTKQLHLAILNMTQHYYQNPARFNTFKVLQTPTEEKMRIQEWMLRDPAAKQSLFRAYNRVILEGFKKVFQPQEGLV